MNREDCYVGQIVKIQISRGKFDVAKVVKILPKNIRVITEGGVTYTAHPSYLYETSDEFIAGRVSGLMLGSVVRFKAAHRNKYPLMVVLGDHAGKWRCAPLGGDNGKYFRGIDASELEVVPFNLDIQE